MKAAAALATEMFKEGRAAVDVVEAVVALLEDDGTFDAGRGSFLNTIGEVEMDAIIAKDTLEMGAVCAVQNIRNPVRLARRLMEDTKCVMLVGSDGCKRFAKEQGIGLCDTKDLLVGRELERYNALMGVTGYESKSAFGRVKTNGMGTVGCVAVDASGNIASALSTGGTPFKRPGRVGDTPLWGAGCFVERGVGGAAATGYGEDLIRVLFARSAIDGLIYASGEPDATHAAQRAVQRLEEKASGLGGIIVAAPGQRGIGIAFNTPRMAFAFGTSSMKEAAWGVEREELQRALASNEELM